MHFFPQPITIVNLPYTYTDLSEDTEVNLALVTIETEDDNTDDTVTCSITDITSSNTSDPIEQNLFRIKETFSGSDGKFCVTWCVLNVSVFINSTTVCIYRFFLMILWVQ